MTSIIAACRGDNRAKMAKLRLSMTYLIRRSLIHVIHFVLFRVRGAYWEGRSWQVLNNCADVKE
ncbi:hypothetical protein M2171_005806 [Bradyrhizobium japonicum USDA 38]|nr:hypothetical protein [Bradyrhizobium japonicum USDA 38]MCS3949188.1 hypothetical protein [Bradyrhizobium japonicum]MCW2218129.1 hypothetical protein [Bradyrhizobium japonicum]MCW2342742.1 hypothetical protein [Bradyrhizobium japonicum]